MNLNEISFFQFDNLVRNRIPFLLINLTSQLPQIYSQGLYQQHLVSLELRTTSENVLMQLTEKKHPKHEALLVVCESGSRSQSLVETLEREGYMNVFFVKGGLQALLADASR